LEPVEALAWLRENMLPAYPLGVYKDADRQAREVDA
jgi:2-oxoglutarate ferredoxin oxidoreductase subunit beta